MNTDLSSLIIHQHNYNYIITIQVINNCKRNVMNSIIYTWHTDITIVQKIFDKTRL